MGNECHQLELANAAVSGERSLAHRASGPAHQQILHCRIELARQAQA